VTFVSVLFNWPACSQLDVRTCKWPDRRFLQARRRPTSGLTPFSPSVAEPSRAAKCVPNAGDERSRKAEFQVNRGCNGPSSGGRLWLGETPAGASSAVNGWVCRWRKAVDGDWPAALANMQAATLREDCRPENASFSEASEEGISEPPNPDRKGEGSHDRG
jgi:hypothetical protein